MMKKLIAMIISLIILTSFTMTAFAGNTEGATDINAPTAVNAAKSGAAANAAGQNEESTSKPEQGSTAANDQKSTYDKEEVKGPDADFFAAIGKALDEGKAVENDLKILLITKPSAINEKVSIYSKKFGISVKTEFDDVVFSVARLNSTTGKYETIEFDGEKSTILACGRDSKEINLEYGINNLLLVSYRNSEKEISKIQYNTIVVEANKEAVADKAVNSDKTVKKSNSDTLTTFNQNLKTFIDNLMGKGK